MMSQHGLRMTAESAEFRIAQLAQWLPRIVYLLIMIILACQVFRGYAYHRRYKMDLAACNNRQGREVEEKHPKQHPPEVLAAAASQTASMPSSCGVG